MPNKWIERVKKFSRENNMSYGGAISDPRCKSSYKQPSIGKELEKEQKINELESLNEEVTFKYLLMDIIHTTSITLRTLTFLYRMQGYTPHAPLFLPYFF